MWITKNKIKIACGIFVAVIVASSAEIGGELIGIQGRALKQKELPPFGMVLIPQGSFNMGLNDQDAISSMNAPMKTVAVDAFWIDQTEITNNEYRQFVQYVFDSISRKLLAEQFEEFAIAEDRMGEPIDPPLINWTPKINPQNPDYAEVLAALFSKKTRSLTGASLRVDKLVYEYLRVDYSRAVHKARKIDEGDEEDDDEGFIVTENVLVYPDTLVWMRDFEYAYNEPFALRYYAHPAYDDYPVVGVNWRQATAFTFWRTKMLQEFAIKNKRFVPHDYRLPSEAEWEYAARGGFEQQMYPWGGPYTYNRVGCYLANFLPMRSRYSIDGGTRTLPVGSYQPNDFGLFDMAGNVAEWTASSFDEHAHNFVNELNPAYTYHSKEGDPLAMTRKTIKGGSWKDIAYFLQCGTRTFEYQDTCKSYIGFRCVRSYLGR
ncbi:MAG: SUMF1/EgtB/PvdO family nonheme iron enzyme [Bacteroidales bacterium]